VEIFQLDHLEKKQVLRAGDLVAYSEREIKHRNILFPMDDMDSLLVNIKNRGAYIIPINIKPVTSFYEFDNLRSSWIGACFGVIAILLLISIGALFFTRGRTIVWYYSLFGVFSFLYFFTEMGYGDIYFWPNSPFLEERMIFIFILGTIISLLLLVYKVFHLNETIQLWLYFQRILLGVAMLFLMLLLTPWIQDDHFFPFYYDGLLVLVFIVFLFTIAAGFVAIKRQVPYADYFLLALSILVIGAMLKPLSLSGVVRYSNFVHYGGMVGLMVNMIAMAALFVMRYFDGLSYSVKLENQIIHLERAALQAQMNPHFIFNSLNSIQNFIARNDQIKAMDYLSNFAKLIRRILNASGEKTITLEEELTMLQGYLKLEKLRFKDKFDYKFELAENVNTSEVKIPPLLIQPFIENAVIHGMKNKSGSGHINVGFSIQFPYLKVIIEDNGVGIKNAVRSSHRSHGMSITQKRLSHLNKSNKDFSIEIKDRNSIDGESAGTVVTLLINIKST
jgi:hypothetical protein